MHPCLYHPDRFVIHTNGCEPNFSCQVWRRLSQAVLRPDHPLALHKLLFTAAYDGWDAGGDQGLSVMQHQ